MGKPIDDGGPAFPGEHIYTNGEPQRGMSLRDYFAGQALTSALANACDGWYANLADKPEKVQPRASDIARACYALADAMLAAGKEAAHAS